MAADKTPLGDDVPDPSGAGGQIPPSVPVPLGWLGTNLLGAYLLAVPAIALWLLWLYLPKPDAVTEQHLIGLAILGGVIGSYMHAAQSFTVFVGNRQACRSWVWWYVLRLPLGAALGVVMFVVVRAGLLATVTSSAQSSASINPYAVLAFSALAGWFSKQATDKLAEVFDTLFKSEKKGQYRDQLKIPPRPTIESLIPMHEGADTVLVVHGSGFEAGARVRLDKTTLETEMRSNKELKAKVPTALASGKHRVDVVNPSQLDAPSESQEVDFAVKL